MAVAALAPLPCRPACSRKAHPLPALLLLLLLLPLPTQAVLSSATRFSVTYATRVYPSGINYTLMAADAPPGHDQLGLSMQVGLIGII